MPDLVTAVTHDIQLWARSYYIWAALFYFLCVAIIILPLLIVANLWGETTNRILAALSAIFAGAVNWANLGVVAGNFDKARDDLKSAYIQFEIDKNSERLLTEYNKARSLVRSWAPGVPQISTTNK